MRRVQTSTAAETEALGAEVAETLRLGDVVLVEGELGAGKTTFVRGASRALGVKGPVTSPSFTLGQRYHGKVTVAHLDLIRIEHTDAEEPGFLADYLGPDTIGFVEWPAAGNEELLALARLAVRVRITHAGGDRRVVEIE
jgi:tRNA threonylcarbamoyladenosine biosynthesis protein TsaE